MKVLLIEDSPEIINGVSLTFRLRWPEAALIAADNGAKGIEMVEAESPDMVILDINLKEENIDGVDVLQRIKEIRPEQNVYMFTGYPISNENGKIIEKNALGVLHKPFKSPLSYILLI